MSQSKRLPIINSINSVKEFQNLIENNKGIIIIKLGAKWCAPCSRIEPYVMEIFNNVPENIQCVIVDIDKCVEFYSFLKKKRVVNGVPVILCYLKENKTFFPDDMVVGADKIKLDEFFIRCFENYEK